MSEVCLQTDENGLGFRVTEAHVVFEHAWAFGCEHQADEEYAAKGKTFVACARERRLDDFKDDPFKRQVVKHGRVCDRAHAPGIWAGVMFADALMVARGWHQSVIAPICE